LNIKGILIFFTNFSETFLILWRIQSDIIINVLYTGLHVKYPLFLSYFNQTWIFSTDFRKILKYQISWKSVKWKPNCPVRTDGRADMTRLTVAIRKTVFPFCNQTVSDECHNLFPFFLLQFQSTDRPIRFEFEIPLTKRTDVKTPDTWKKNLS